MSDIKPVRGTGAPLRIFFLVSMIWILGRVAWGSDITYDPMISSTGHADPEHSIIAGVLAMDPIVRTPQRVYADWPKEQVKLTRFDFIAIDGPTSEYLRSWTALSLTRNGLTSNQANRNNVSIPHTAAVNLARNNFVLPERCCGYPNDEMPQNKAVRSLGRNQKLGIFGPNLSAYFWLFARSGSSIGLTNPFGTALQPSGSQYGGSQAGGILTYRLVGNQSRNLSAYSRISSALAVKGQGEVAIGAKIKPIKGLPISIYAESRIRESTSDRHAEAVFVAGGSGPDEIMHNAFLETYGQAGYVFQKNGSYFFDGSASIQKKLMGAGAGQISLGGAVWAGGQEGANRLDMGPRVNIDVPFGDSNIRASVDWRQRVAGNAEPDSGLAVSLSTGF